MEVSREWLAFLREQFPAGSRIRLREMQDTHTPVPPGTMGTLESIDDVGQFHMKWDNGRSLALIIGVDSFTVLPPEPQTLKFYMPLTGVLYGEDEWGDREEYGSELDGQDLRQYETAIREALQNNQMPEEKQRGLMHWYGENDAVNDKVLSAVFQVESRAGQLWGVAECRVLETLTLQERETLMEYLSGQASDGWGEGFEQRPISVGDQELYVSFWNDGAWSIQTEQERFEANMQNRLPDLCWSVLPGEGTLICIQRGETGYTVSDWNTDDPEHNRKLADYRNRKRGITPEQEQNTKIALWCYIIPTWSIDAVTVNPNLSGEARTQAERVLAAAKQIYQYGTWWSEIPSASLTTSADRELAYPVTIDGKQYKQQIFIVHSSTFVSGMTASVAFADPCAVPAGTKIVDMENREISQITMEGSGFDINGQFKVLYPADAVESQNGSIQFTIRADVYQYGVYYASCAEVDKYGKIQNYICDTDPTRSVSVDGISKYGTSEIPDDPDTGLKIIKIQEGTQTPLEGAVFEIKGPGGDVIGQYSTDTSGTIVVPLTILNAKIANWSVQSMIKILFLCHGNICRSPMAEFIMKDLVKKAGLEQSIQIESAATSTEEIGNPVYPPACRKLSEHGIDCSGKRARQLLNSDYEKYDLLIGMDHANLRSMYQICGGDFADKMHLLMDFTNRPGEVADPWYTGDFDATWRDVEEGCQGLLQKIINKEV